MYLITRIRFLSELISPQHAAISGFTQDPTSSGTSQKLSVELAETVEHPAIPFVPGVEVVGQQPVLGNVATGVLSQPAAGWNVANEAIQIRIELGDRMIDQAGLAVVNRAIIDRGAGEGRHGVSGTLDELEVRFVLVESRRLKRQQGNIGGIQKLVVTLVRAKGLERFVRSIQGIEERPVVNDLNAALDRRTWPAPGSARVRSVASRPPG